MKACCDDKSEALAKLREQQSHVLKIVLVLNAAMFVVELLFGILSRSNSLKADSLDMLGDAFVYGFSLYVLDRGVRARARAAQMKGFIMVALGFCILGDALWRAFQVQLPEANTMGLVAGLALAANAVCLALLARHRSDDLNMRSTWICSRNDIVANLSVIVAALLVDAWDSRWPDLAVGVAIATLFLMSAWGILRDARRELATT